MILRDDQYHKMGQDYNQLMLVQETFSKVLLGATRIFYGVEYNVDLGHFSIRLKCKNR